MGQSNPDEGYQLRVDSLRSTNESHVAHRPSRPEHVAKVAFGAVFERFLAYFYSVPVSMPFVELLHARFDLQSVYF